MSVAIDLKDRATCEHLRVLHVFSLIELLGKDIEVHAWLYS